MAIVALKSVDVTNRDAHVANDSWFAGSGIKEMVSKIAVANGDSIGSTYRFCRVRSTDRVSALLLYNTAIAVSGAMDIGLYDVAAVNAGAVVSVQFFAIAASLLAARQAPSDVTFQGAAGPAVLTNLDKRIWEMLGLTKDPVKEFDVTGTLTVALGGAGTIGIKAQVCQ